MAQATTEGASEIVEGVRFSFMTDKEVRKHSVLKITNPILLDSIGNPMAGGLYDPLLGPIDEKAHCKSCGLKSFECPGHCGHIDFVLPVYNPLLFDMLFNLLRKTCFFCQHFLAGKEEVEACTIKLKMISKGDIAGAKNYIHNSDNKGIDLEEGDGSHMSSSTILSDSQSDRSEQTHQQEFWTSVQLIEAKSVLKEFMGTNSKTCKNCEAKNPKLKKPIFGSITMDMSFEDAEKNFIKGFKVGGIRYDEELQSAGGEDDTTSEVLTVNDQSEDDRSDTAGSFSATSSSKKRKVKKKGSKEASDFKDFKSNYSGFLLPSRVLSLIKDLWENEAEICSYISDIQQERLTRSSQSTTYSMFFLEALLVPPTKFRPAAVVGEKVMENPQTMLLSKVLEANTNLRNAHINKIEGSKIADRWRDLQQAVNVLFDSKTATRLDKRKDNTGICQLLEKKEGIFRQKMMGKRVNFACRSVISPDPYLAVNEIGVPPYFALRLTYPERVTPWNVVKLRDAIINGPDIHPGATLYSDKVSTVKLPPHKPKRISISRKLPSSRGTAIQSKNNSGYEFEGKVVHRHLQDGDIVLVNRQPTLHKPSIMAHVVKVLKGEKTLRMHYANCSSYNADFDGDEMNVHLPQDEISRAEAYNIVNANNQYIVPTRGDTVRGLIQDHIVSSVLLTMKDTFLNRQEFYQLLFASGVFAGGSSKRAKISIVDGASFVKPVTPAVCKPKPLWTGKQVITSILNHLTRGYTPCIVDNKVKIPEQYFQGKEVKQDKSKKTKTRKKEKEESKSDLKEADETQLLIWKNELVRGVIDKAQFGKYGLVHTVQELYGSDIAGLLLGAFSRLFTSFLQFHGFTCGMDDLMVSPACDKEMKMELEGEDVGEKVHRKFVNLENQNIGTQELQLETEKIIRSNGATASASLDNLMQTEVRDKGSMISKKWLPKGLLKPFPQNCISLMTISGAKGSSVNFQQISFLLGQQELEGKRVPRMISGKTLPSFPPWDFTARSGGYIIDRFLTGLRPQEYYFHCMAGREGLVDTAVKTSRSGYLQRCLVKNLESLKVSYDYTVRDSDGSIVQFCYGEDGVDVHQTSFLNNVELLRANREIVCQKFSEPLEFNSYIQELPQGVEDKVKRFKEKVTKENKDDLLMLIRQKYLSSLAQPGEPVGVIAGQSIGEPSTQMTLNTFHLAGRGEMNVTLGIPRLQEILMTAAANIKTPIITCPLLEGRSMEDAERLADKVKKLSVAELMQSIEVSKLPLVIHNNQPCRIYKVKVQLKQPKHVPLRNCQETLRIGFLRAIEDAIERHVGLLSRINGIKSAKKSKAEASSEADNDDDDDDKENDDDDGETDNEETADDLGSDYNKRKRQNSDSVDYEDESEEEEDDGTENEENETKDGTETNDENVAEEQEEDEDEDKKKDKLVQEFEDKKNDRHIFVEVKGLRLEAHFRFTNEPEILLAEVVQKAATKVYIIGSGKLNECQPVKYSVNVKQVCWNEKVNQKMKNKKKDDEEECLPCALQASGIELPAFWDMEEDLDVDHVYTNNIHTMLTTYGVEAARTSIIMEMKNVFGSYGVEIDYRHLSLIADCMTHSGGYRPMSRFGNISESVSPFLKMSFETASKFIVEAASFGMNDNLETPSARICLGLPVKVGTGSMEVMQKLEYN